MAITSRERTADRRNSYLSSIGGRASQSSGTELAGLMTAMHGSTASVSDTMNKLVPFPRLASSTNTVDVLDLSVNVRALPAQAAASVDVSVRYASNEPLDVICGRYEQQLNDTAKVCGPFVQSLTDGRLVLDSRLEERGGTHFEVSAERRQGYRRVRLNAGYECPAPLELINRFSCWHEGLAPVAELATPIELELATFSQGRRNVIGLYTTTYALPGLTSGDVRRSVDERLATEGLRYREPTPGMLFVQNAPFEAEVHLFEADDGTPHLAFAGEFQIC